MAAFGMVILSGVGASAITGGAAAPGLWLAWQAAVLAVEVRLSLSRRRQAGLGRPEPD